MTSRRQIAKVAFWACGLTGLSIAFFIVDSTVQMTPLRSALGYVAWGLSVVSVVLFATCRLWR